MWGWGRAAVFGAAFFATGWLSAPAQAAAAYPDHPVKIIAPFAAGGPTDVDGADPVAKTFGSLEAAVLSSRTMSAPAAISA